MPEVTAPPTPLSQPIPLLDKTFQAVKGVDGKVMYVGKDVAGVLYTRSSLQQGQQMHKLYHAGEAGKEFRLSSGKRIDYLDIGIARFMN